MIRTLNDSVFELIIDELQRNKITSLIIQNKNAFGNKYTASYFIDKDKQHDNITSYNKEQIDILTDFWEKSKQGLIKDFKFSYNLNKFLYKVSYQDDYIKKTIEYHLSEINNLIYCDSLYDNIKSPVKSLLRIVKELK